jgi:hypothetical protein
VKSANWPLPAQNELADEAIRLGPAIAAARIREDNEAIRILYRNYIERANELRIPGHLAWKIFGVSQVLWIAHLVRQVEESENLSPDNAAMALISIALEHTSV